MSDRAFVRVQVPDPQPGEIEEALCRRPTLLKAISAYGTACWTSGFMETHWNLNESEMAAIEENGRVLDRWQEVRRLLGLYDFPGNEDVLE